MTCVWGYPYGVQKIALPRKLPTQKTVLKKMLNELPHVKIERFKSRLKSLFWGQPPPPPPHHHLIYSVQTLRAELVMISVSCTYWNLCTQLCLLGSMNSEECFQCGIS